MRARAWRMASRGIRSGSGSATRLYPDQAPNLGLGIRTRHRDLSPAAPAPGRMPVPLLLEAATRLGQELAELGEGIGAERRRASPNHREAEGTVQRGELLAAEPPPLALAKPQANHRLPSRNFIIERNRVTPEPDHGRQRIQPAPLRFRHHGLRLEQQRCLEKLLPALHWFELGKQPLQQRRVGCDLQRSAGAAPPLPERGRGPADSPLIGMGRFPFEQSAGETEPRRIAQLGWYGAAERLDV